MPPLPESPTLTEDPLDAPREATVYVEELEPPAPPLRDTPTLMRGPVTRPPRPR